MHTVSVTMPVTHEVTPLHILYSKIQSERNFCAMSLLEFVAKRLVDSCSQPFLLHPSSSYLSQRDCKARCYVTISTRRILREKADCKQSKRLVSKRFCIETTGFLTDNP